MSLINTGPSRKNVGLMFDRIAKRYDLLNHLLSGRRDVSWRKKVAKLVPKERELTFLDLATGTGDLIFTILDTHPNIVEAIGIDISSGMLENGIKKARNKIYSDRVRFQQGDAQEIPLEDNSVDLVTIAFGIRNVENYPKALEEMYRVLKKGGVALILEFSLPPPGLFRNAYIWYFRNLLPMVGGWISGDREAYHYLNKTVESFPYGTHFCKQLETVHFSQVKAHPLSFGIATIYQGEKDV